MLADLQVLLNLSSMAKLDLDGLTCLVDTSLLRLRKYWQRRDSGKWACRL